jgi:hypothetical protein
MLTEECSLVWTYLFMINWYNATIHTNFVWTWQGFTFELEEGRVVIEGFVNEINNKHFRQGVAMGPICNIQCGRADSFFCSYQVCLRHNDFISLFVVVPKAPNKYSQNGSHGNTLPEVNCNRYLSNKFVPKIRHVILIDIRAKATKYHFI